MRENTRFYVCPICGNVIGLIEGDIKHMSCCGKPMQLLEANTTDAAQEKHLPVYEKTGEEIVVKVGSVEHPMEKEHYITWVAQMTDDCTIRVRLFPEQSKTIKFPYVKGATLYAYCNKHGLWATEVE